MITSCNGETLDGMRHTLSRAQTSSITIILSAKERSVLKQRNGWWESRFNKPFNYSWSIDADGSISDPGHKVYEYTGKHPENVERNFNNSLNLHPSK